MENLINSLEENLKELYRKAIDADDKLNELKKQGHGKFETIFKNEKLFSVKAEKFMPYLEETAEDILAIKQSEQSPTELQPKIETVVKKLHQLHSTLADFSLALKN